MGQILQSKGAELREMIIAEVGCAGFITDFVQAGGSIGMWESNAALAESGFEWLEVDPPSAGPTGINGSALRA